MEIYLMVKSFLNLFQNVNNWFINYRKNERNINTQSYIALLKGKKNIEKL